MLIDIALHTTNQQARLISFPQYKRVPPQLLRPSNNSISDPTINQTNNGGEHAIQTSYLETHRLVMTELSRTELRVSSQEFGKLPIPEQVPHDTASGACGDDWLESHNPRNSLLHELDPSPTSVSIEVVAHDTFQGVDEVAVLPVTYEVPHDTAHHPPPIPALRFMNTPVKFTQLITTLFVKTHS